jgi:hypothetical protein
MVQPWILSSGHHLTQAHKRELSKNFHSLGAGFFAFFVLVVGGFFFRMHVPNLYGCRFKVVEL